MAVERVRKNNGSTIIHTYLAKLFSIDQTQPQTTPKCGNDVTLFKSYVTFTEIKRITFEIY
jgi:hypothetical protein